MSEPTVKIPSKRRAQGAGLALVPVVVAAFLGFLSLPRAVPPDEVPLPEVDGRALEKSRAIEDRLIADFDREGLVGDVRALGSALRAYHRAQLDGTADTAATKQDVERARAVAVGTAGMEKVHALFVVQRTAFFREVAAYETTGVESDELRELGGAFLPRLRQAGWVRDHRILASDDERRVLYKMMWGLDVGLDQDAPFVLDLEERRILYRLYLRLPHPPEHLRVTLAKAKEHARDAAECAKVEDEERAMAEKWRVSKITVLGEFDPTYPTEYALGIAHYRLGDYVASAADFRRHLDRHPSGPLTLRAQNYLKAALQAAEGTL